MVSPFENVFYLQRDERHWLPCAIERDATKVFDVVAYRNWCATEDQLWTPLEARLCNKAQIQAL